MKNRARVFVQLLGAALSLPAHGEVYQHYLLYNLLVPTKTTSSKVYLRDQFLDGRFTVAKPHLLLNPVEKQLPGQFGSAPQIFPIIRPDLHYLGHPVQAKKPFPGAFVHINNQFERSNLKVAAPRFLLAPAAKQLVAPGATRGNLVIPQEATHYLCYEVERQQFALPLGLQDQFQNRQAQVVERAHLCNPVRKKHKHRLFAAQINNQENHLTCYRVVEPTLLERQVLVKDQFFNGAALAREERELCVPTQKTCALNSSHVTNLLYRGSAEIPLGQTGSKISSLTMRLRELPNRGTDSFFDVFIELSIDTQIGGHRELLLDGEGTTSRSLGDPDFDLLRLRAKLPQGDPDFDLLRITAGSTFGLPSPGHSTLTRQNDGTWAVDSFFDITYRIDFKASASGGTSGGTSGGISGEISGSTTGTIRVQASCPENRDIPDIHVAPISENFLKW